MQLKGFVILGCNFGNFWGVGEGEMFNEEMRKWGNGSAGGSTGGSTSSPSTHQALTTIEEMSCRGSGEGRRMWRPPKDLSRFSQKGNFPSDFYGIQII
jgi:hypothetical protein